jgi:paraquat-inducible protein A
MTAPLTAEAAGLLGCRVCGRVTPVGNSACPHCGSHFHSRGTELQSVWAWLIAGFICYIPANLYPMLVTKTLTSAQAENTIVSGVIELLKHHEYAVASIVFFASVIVPIGKFLAIAFLGMSLRRHATLSSHRRHKLLHIVEFIGRWSMIDVFVVAILSSLVQLGSVAQIHPGAAAILFALSVVFTMRAAQSFDPRLIWEKDDGSLE